MKPITVISIKKTILIFLEFSTFVALLLADYDVDIHHILKPPERQKMIIANIQELGIVGLI